MGSSHTKVYLSYKMYLPFAVRPNIFTGITLTLSFWIQTSCHLQYAKT